MKRILFTLIASAFYIGVEAQETFVRKPALNPSGEDIAFGYQGDIWTLNLSENTPKRITLHEAYESAPVFSPDGKSLAFSGNRFGSEDVYTVSAKGGRPERLTFHRANDELTQWDAKGRLIFSTERVFQQVERDHEIYAIPAEGGTPQRILDAVGEMATVSPNGRFIAFVRGACRLTRENYVGPANNEIWIYDTQEKSFSQLTKNKINDFLPKWKNNEELLYLSAVKGRYGLISQSFKPGTVGDPNILLSFDDEGIRHFDVQGEKVVYARGAHIYLMTQGQKPTKIEINIPTDYRFYPVEKESFSGSISAYEISPNGKTAALQIRGELFATELDKEESATVNLTQHSFYDRGQQWLNDSVLLFSSDREGGIYQFFTVRSSDAQKSSLFKTLKREIEQSTNSQEDLRNPIISPDGQKVVYEKGQSKLLVADIDEKGKLSNTNTLVDAWHGASGVAWSPDSRYIAYNHSDLNFNSEVYIQDVAGAMDPVNVSMHPGRDYGAVWSEDGSKLGFISDRNDDDADIWFVWLKEEDWLISKEEREEGYYFDPEEESEKDKDKDEDKESTEEVKEVEIDFEDLHDRLEQVTSMNGNEGSLLISKDGETFYFSSYSELEKGSDLYSVKYDGSDLKQVTKGGTSPGGLQWDKDFKGMYYVSRGKLYHLDPSSGKPTAYPHRAKMTIDKAAERKQVFDEAWKILNQRFYDPDFHGQNWQALRDKYRPWALSASTDQDFRYIFNLMLGRLNASHMGIYGGNPEKVQSDRTGLLGIEIIPAEKGVEVTRVVPRSPAARPQNQLKKGDRITKINGKAITGSANFYAQLAEVDTDQILMEVSSKSGEEREIVIRPTSSLSTELYEEWVAERQRLTEEYSNGRLGYIHIKGMNKPSFERFERELMASGHGKEGIVIDVRFNGGGWTTDYLLAVLSVRQHAYTVPRGATANLSKNHPQFSEYYPYSERLPLSGWTKPSVAMCNESSYSNAEIFSHAYKQLGIGTLVGQPTFGAVISTGGTGLLDGSFLRLPFRGWYVKATGENMENGPAVPQVLVENKPDSKVEGSDMQLKKAVEVLLQQIDQKKP